MTKRVVILGGGGRMGVMIARCLLRQDVPELALVGAVDAAGHPSLGQDVGRLTGREEAGIALAGRLDDLREDADVGIDFTSPPATARHATLFAEWGTPLVIGTTGLAEAEQAQVDAASQRIPVVQAPNMSLGVNLLFALVEHTASSLREKGYDIEIIERHHRMKKDAPSGTAWGLGWAAAKGSGVELESQAVHGRFGMTDVRPPHQIGFHAVRGGDTVGDHTVLFAGEGECIELSHRATSRETFARGALQATRWVVAQPPGLYSMNHVLGL
jgi:4-hydroxy-tetrahydrodipicolinate reductase